MKDNLARALTDRGVNGADRLVDAVTDVDGAFRAVDYFDAQQNATPGLLVHMMRTGEHFDYRPKAKPQTRSERYWAKVTDLEAWFTKPQAEMTALTAITMEALGVNPTRKRLEARGKASQPWLWEQAA